MAARMTVSAAILCGGEGRRMGRTDKGQLRIAGRTFIDRQLEVLRKLTPHLLLVDRDATYACPEDVQLVGDVMANAGALGGIYTALQASVTDRVIVLACDMPYVTTEFLAFLSGYRPEADVVIPRDEEGRHPLCGVFHRRIAPALKTRIDARMLRVEDALTELDVQHVSSDVVAPFDRSGKLLLNVNTPHDYREAAGADHEGTAFA